MIDIAKTKMEITAFHDDVKNIGKYLEPNSITLVLMHFILSYVEAQTIISDVVRLLHQGGICSIATSTFESFKTMQTVVRNFMSAEEMKELSQVPENPDALKTLLTEAGFDIIEEDILTEKVHFANFEELYNWGIKSGWIIEYVLSLTEEQISTLATTQGIFPLEDDFQASILLIRKNGSMEDRPWSFWGRKDDGCQIEKS
jgi:hypothetical protein